jgi:NAD(P)-dependent dehydrogenase (short-subunit alcohol dehydrogenase family)
MELGLKNKVAIVTGGSKGIGRAAALGLLAEGGSALIVARGAEGLAAACDAANAQDRSRLATLAADLTEASAIKRAADYCLERFGRIDILINNAGSARGGDFLELSDDAWLDDWRLKFFGYVRMARAVLPRCGPTAASSSISSVRPR